MTVLKSYGSLNFTSTEREKFLMIDKHIDRLKNRIETKKNIIKKYEDEIAELQQEIRQGWSIASGMKTKLQERCKHNGNTYVERIDRDFGDDILITRCVLCDDSLRKNDVKLK